MVGVHVGLDLEHEAGHLRLVGGDDPPGGLLGARRRRELGERVDEVAHAEIAQRAAEQHRRQVALEKRLPVEWPATVDRQRQLLDRRGALVLGQQRGDGGIVGPGDRNLGAVLPQAAQRLAPDVIGAGERAAAPDRPVQRRGVERQRLFDFVEQVERDRAFRDPSC